MAVGFTALANLLLLATWVFSEWLPLQTRLIGLAALTIVWLLARWQSRGQRHASMAVEDDSQQQEGEGELLPAERDLLFREAQGHYLRNDWVATEQLLLRLLKQDARDVESRLMLATLWRHQGRRAEATRQLDRLQRLEAAENWQHEIAAERAAMELSSAETTADTSAGVTVPAAGTETPADETLEDESFEANAFEASVFEENPCEDDDHDDHRLAA